MIFIKSVQIATIFKTGESCLWKGPLQGVQGVQEQCKEKIHM